MVEQQPDRNLAMELVRVTEAAALAAGRWMGRGDKNARRRRRGRRDAHRVEHRSSIDGVVVIGEGEKDEAPMLYNGERIGTAGQSPRWTSRSTRSTAPRSARSDCDKASR